MVRDFKVYTIYKIWCNLKGQAQFKRIGGFKGKSSKLLTSEAEKGQKEMKKCPLVIG